MKRRALAAFFFAMPVFLAVSASARLAPANFAIIATVADTRRTDANRAGDPYRHLVKTLGFFGQTSARPPARPL